MWPAKDIIYSEQGKWGEAFVSKDENGGGKELVWLFIVVESHDHYYLKTLYLNTFTIRTPEKDELYIKACKEIVFLIKKMYGQTQTKKMRKPINKIAVNMLKENLH
jgi:hypothetical protein